MLKTFVSGIKMYLDRAVNQLRDEVGWKSETTEQLFSETVTTVDKPGADAPIAVLLYTTLITANPLKVTFDGVEYTCTGRVVDGNSMEYGASYKDGTYEFDFSEYPFCIYAGYDGNNSIFTETPGTYTVSASTDTVTYTDAFQKAVKSLGGAVEVSSIDDADVVVVEVSEYVDLIPRAFCTIKTDGTVAFVTNNTTVDDSLAPGLHLFYRCEASDNGLSFIGKDAYLTPNDRGSGVVIHHNVMTRYSDAGTMTIWSGSMVRLADNGNIKYYKIGLPHSSANDGGNDDAAK